MFEFCNNYNSSENKVYSNEDLFKAVSNEDKNLVVKILSNNKGNKVDINAKNFGKDMTSLSSALTNENFDIVKLLINNEADVNANDVDKRTPLHEASSHNGNLEIVKLLIEKGANINAKDLDGLTPRDYALKNEHKEIAKYIEERQ